MRIVAAVAFGLGLSSPAWSERLTCDITSISRDLDARIGDAIVIAFSRETGVAKVDDGFPKRDDLPHRGRISKDSKKAVSFVWGQPGMLQFGYIVPLDLRLSVRLPSGQAMLTSSTAHWVGARRLFSARARCKEE